MVILRNHNDTVYVGTELSLTARISFRDVSGIDVDTSVDICWTRGSDVISNDTRTTVSLVSGGDTRYTASLRLSPITLSDYGLISATVTVGPTITSQYIQTVMESGSDMLGIIGNNVFSDW